jgi:hypothetical protein
MLALSPGKSDYRTSSFQYSTCPVSALIGSCLKPVPSTERVGCKEKLRTLIPRKPTEVLSAWSCRQLERSAHQWVGAVLQIALDEVDLAAYAEASRVEGQAVLSPANQPQRRTRHIGDGNRTESREISQIKGFNGHARRVKRSNCKKCLIQG